LESQVPDKNTEKSYTLKGLLNLVGRYTLQTLGNLEPAGKGRVYMDALKIKEPDLTPNLRF
jgi:hypothetical protein